MQSGGGEATGVTRDRRPPSDGRRPHVRFLLDAVSRAGGGGVTTWAVSSNSNGGALRGYVQVQPSHGVRIATLGPPGTSSELAADHLGDVLAAQGVMHTGVDLYASFEDAAGATLLGLADLAVVANAYRDANELYMDPELRIVGVYVFDTPDYGLAGRAGADLSSDVVVVSHSAPVPLLRQLTVDGVRVRDVRTVSSTSEAARLVADGTFELALTNKKAVEEFGLTFRSPTRPIRMSWAVFAPTRRPALTGAGP